METTHGEENPNHMVKCLFAVTVLICFLLPVSVPVTTARPLPTTLSGAVTTGVPTTEPLPPTVAEVTPGFNPTPMALLRHTHLAAASECFRYLHGTFQSDITIIGG